MILSLPCPLPPKGLLLPILDAEYALPPDDRGTPCETGSKRGQDDVIPFFKGVLLERFVKGDGNGSGRGIAVLLNIAEERLFRDTQSCR